MKTSPKALGREGGSVVVSPIGRLYTLEGAVKKKGRKIAPEDLGVIDDAAMTVSRGRVEWVGRAKDLPSSYKKSKKTSAAGKIVMPGFVDSHTHLVFAGDRSREFEMRLAGKTYQEIASAGGGIVNTMSATRETAKKLLFDLSKERLKNFLKQGVTTVEVKTGYGLSLESEMKCLEVIDKLKSATPATVKSTFLGAHAVPPEYKGHQGEYVAHLSLEWLPKIAALCDYVDMFIDEGYFTTEDATLFFNEARKRGRRIKVHADELKLTGGTEIAVKFGALSADHLLKIGDKEIGLLAENETTATLLPTTAFFLGTAYAPARKLLDRGARVALASDYNPGTSPTQDISLVGALSALQMGMRIDEIVVALTLNGAYALGLEKSKGALQPGFDADFLVVQANSPAQLFYEFGQRVQFPEIWCSGRKVRDA